MRSFQHNTLPPPDIMADSLQFTQPNHYIPPSYYAQPPGSSNPLVQPRQEPLQRKRPKYTRSKTGCLTCRVKKIKCDETKPNCMRCTHGQRDCTWPEGVPPRKKSTPRKDSIDGRPSTAESSGISEASTPPMRDHSPPRRAPTADLGLPPLASRRHSDSYLQLPPMLADQAERGQSIDRLHPQNGYPMQHANTNPVLSMIPEYTHHPHHRYDTYNNGMHHHQPNGISNRSSAVPSASNDRSVGQSMNHWNTNTPLMAPLDPIASFFHTGQERNLIRHYCDHSLSFIMAVPSENPVVAANLPLVFNGSPGSDPSAEALRLALLGVAAIHQSFLLARSGVTQHGADDMLRAAYAFRMNSKTMLARACNTAQGAQSDASLAASIAIALMDIFSGGRNWLRNMDLAKTLVSVRGGPAVLLARSSLSASTPGGVDLDQFGRARLLLEILAVYEIFGCLATGTEPTLLSPTGNSWWLEDTHATYSSVEAVFGMSRAFIPLLARVTAFVSRCINQTAHITEVVDDKSPDADEDDTAECQELYNLLESWSQPVEDISTRVDIGNRIYQKAAQIMLLRDVLRVPPTDELVQQCADTVLRLCSDCSNSNMGVDLIWPVIIAGSHMYSTNRTRVIEIFQAFRTQCCYEVDTSEQIVLQVWKRLDQGHPQAEWRSVMPYGCISPVHRAVPSETDPFRCSVIGAGRNELL